MFRALLFSYSARNQIIMYKVYIFNNVPWSRRFKKYFERVG
jgi:hypothetical protein